MELMLLIVLIRRGLLELSSPKSKTKLSAAGGLEECDRAGSEWLCCDVVKAPSRIQMAAVDDGTLMSTLVVVIGRG